MWNKKLIRHSLYALYKCLYHWEAIAAGCGKNEYFFKWKKSYPPRHGCFCCEYAITLIEIAYRKMSSEDKREELAKCGMNGGIGYTKSPTGELLRCFKCPLTGFAWEPRAGAFCQREDSPFALFTYYYRREEYNGARFYARKLVKCIQEAISDSINKNLKYK